MFVVCVRFHLKISLLHIIFFGKKLSLLYDSSHFFVIVFVFNDFQCELQTQHFPCRRYISKQKQHFFVCSLWQCNHFFQNLYFVFLFLFKYIFFFVWKCRILTLIIEYCFCIDISLISFCLLRFLLLIIDLYLFCTIFFPKKNWKENYYLFKFFYYYFIHFF